MRPPSWRRLLTGKKTRSSFFSRWSQDGLRWPKMAPRWPQDAPRWPQDGPRWPQDGPKMPQDGPRWLQDGPKMAQDALTWPKMAPTWPKKAPKRARNGPRWSQKCSIGLIRPYKAHRAMIVTSSCAAAWSFRIFCSLGFAFALLCFAHVLPSLFLFLVLFLSLSNGGGSP